MYKKTQIEKGKKFVEINQSPASCDDNKSIPSSTVESREPDVKF